MNSAPTAPVHITRVCVDLNVWISNFLAHRAGRHGTAAQTVVDSVQRGVCTLGALQLGISWGMLDWLAQLLAREFQAPETIVSAVTDAIAGFATFGPEPRTPQLTLGGVGVLPMRDAEDAHVMETALAARADYIVTVNMADFMFKGVRIIKPGRILEYPGPAHSLTILHTYDAARILRP